MKLPKYKIGDVVIVPWGESFRQLAIDDAIYDTARQSWEYYSKHSMHYKEEEVNQIVDSSSEPSCKKHKMWPCSKCYPSSKK